MKLPIYLDYAATTPSDPRVVNKMMQYLTLEGDFGNPNSRSHRFGWRAEEAVDVARNQVADLLNVSSREIIFTSGATESNNLAIKGIAYAYKDKGKHIITSKIEHKSVINTCCHLELEGFEVSYLNPQPDGLVDISLIEATIRKDTILISIMHVNNEIGTIQNLYAISKFCDNYDIFFHVDAAQSIGKILIDLKKIKIDLMSFSAHKIYGPKGIGGLYIRYDSYIKLQTQIHGGGQEYGLRSGTLPVHQIVGIGEAYRIAKLEMSFNNKHIQILRKKFLSKINHINCIQLNGNLTCNIGSILNITFINRKIDDLIMSLKNLAISSGSSCMSAILQPSYVLIAIGLSNNLASSSLRFSFGKFTSEQEINYATNLIEQAVAKN